MKAALTLFVLALLAAAAAAGQATFTEFMGTETLAGPPIDPGTVSCPGGQPTGFWPLGPPCTPGSRFHVRGLVFAYAEAATDPRFTGAAQVTVNANWDGFTELGPGSGPMWGTVRLEVMQGEVKTGEVWEGTWTGVRSVTAAGAYSSIRGTLHGNSGAIDGLQAEWNVVYTPSSPVGAFTGRILAPGGK